MTRREPPKTSYAHIHRERRGRAGWGVVYFIRDFFLRSTQQHTEEEQRSGAAKQNTQEEQPGRRRTPRRSSPAAAARRGTVKSGSREVQTTGGSRGPASLGTLNGNPGPKWKSGAQEGGGAAKICNLSPARHWRRRKIWHKMHPGPQIWWGARSLVPRVP